MRLFGALRAAGGMNKILPMGYQFALRIQGANNELETEPFYAFAGQAQPAKLLGLEEADGKLKQAIRRHGEKSLSIIDPLQALMLAHLASNDHPGALACARRMAELAKPSLPSDCTFNPFAAAEGVVSLLDSETLANGLDILLGETKLPNRPMTRKIDRFGAFVNHANLAAGYASASRLADARRHMHAASLFADSESGSLVQFCNDGFEVLGVDPDLIKNPSSASLGM
jgi:hypothetical protein